MYQCDWIEAYLLNDPPKSVKTEKLNNEKKQVLNSFCWSGPGSGHAYGENTGSTLISVEINTSSGKRMSRIIPPGEDLSTPLEFLEQGCMAYTAKCLGDGDCQAELYMTHPK